MNRVLLRNAALGARRLLSSPAAVNPGPSPRPLVVPLADRTLPRIRFFSSENDSGTEAPANAPEADLVPAGNKEASVDVTDVGNKGKFAAGAEIFPHKGYVLDVFTYCSSCFCPSVELKKRIEKYFEGDEEALPSIFEAILQRRLTKKHEETDDELLDELEMQPIDNVRDSDFESDFEELHSTDEEIDDLYNARDIVMKRMIKDEYFNMDDKKWEEIVEDAVKHGYMQDTKECEQILEDMLSWDKLLPSNTRFHRFHFPNFFCFDSYSQVVRKPILMNC